ncbi:endonuclease/exonuclease/phosphatase family protein [Asticcacaulis solisilvae]|uniref:endonuclease/exonuclease/phosphatase family protein n=1 Tax=Asticcacaulis solisilvae TaxID=1217274 RepID=UPI003FD78836
MQIVKGVFSALCTAIALALVASGFVCVANGHRHVFYLIDIFTLPILSVAVIAILAFAAIRQVRAAALGAVAVLLLGIAMAPQVFPHQAAPDPGAQPIRMVWANLYVLNPEPQKILPWIETKKPDIVAFVEINRDARADLIDKLKVTYPYMVVHYDMLIASRWPLAHAQPRPAGFALVTLTVKTPQGPLNLAVTHLTRPWPFTEPGDQPRQFARLEDSLKPLPPSRFVLAGDFNTTPSAAQLRDFAKSLDIHAAPALTGTWRADLPGLMRVTIDNILASSDLNLSKREVGPDDGSDHRPVYVEIRPVKP